jgi:hypothetical protein
MLLVKLRLLQPEDPAVLLEPELLGQQTCRDLARKTV